MNTPTLETTRSRLHAGLSARRSPQEVAADIVALGIAKELPEDAGMKLATLARHSGYSQMPVTFRAHPGLGSAFTSALRAITAVTDATGKPALRSVDATDPAALSDWLADARAVLGLTGPTQPARRGSNAPREVQMRDWYGDGEYTHTLPAQPKGQRGATHGHVDPRTRYTAEQRRQRLPGVSVRAYRTAVRTVTHLEQRTAVLAAERDREASIAYGKSRLASTITAAELTACDRTAAFVAYYTARLGMRTLFTSGEQARPMDDVADALLTNALAAPTARPDVIARVLTRQQILSRLTPEQQGTLLALTYEQLQASARTLRATYDAGRRSMVVRRGDDSTSWNVASRAFNQARTGWLNLTTALGAHDVIEASCPGKVPALIAADVARWHVAEGGAAHADEAVFADLPTPWDVVLDGANCPAALVREACARHNLDADTTGWTAPYRQGHLERAVVAPELVHGVVVASPALATLMRRLGWFSGPAPKVA